MNSKARGWFSRIFVGALVCAALTSTPAMANETGGPAQPQQAVNAAVDLPFPFPIPGGGGGSSFPIPIPGGGGGFPIPIPGGGGGGFPIPIPGTGGGGLSIPIPLPGGGSIGLPIPIPGTGGGYDNGYYPGGGGGGYYPNYPQDNGYYPGPYDNGGGYYPNDGYPNDGYNYNPQQGYDRETGGRYIPRPDRYDDYPDDRDDDYYEDANPVRGYEVIERNGRVVRIAEESLPLLVYSENPQFNDVAQEAVDEWNRAGREAGVGDFFELVSSPRQADFTIDWNGRLPSRVAAQCELMYSRNAARVKGVTVDTRQRIPRGNLAQQVTHEMGHALGLNHSDNPRDMMYHTTHTNRMSNVTAPQLSRRDVQMLTWLYSQNNFTPIVGRQGHTAAQR